MADIENVPRKKTRTGDLISLPRRGSSVADVEDAVARKQHTGYVSLSIVGGEKNAEQRSRMQKLTLQDIHKGLPSNACIDDRDVIWASDDLLFVGEGLRTNLLGIRSALATDSFKTRKIAVVADVFDRRESRPYLESVFRLITDDITVMLEEVIVPPLRRLVSEYVKDEDGNYVMTRHDVDFCQYVHENGYRVVPVHSHEKIHSFTPSMITIQQSTNHVLMVAPTAFESNIAAAVDNHFMAGSTDGIAASGAELQRKVLQEFSVLHALISQKAKVQVHLFTHEAHHDTPDAVFPNNWFSTHTNLEVGECTLVLYPMKVPNRRKERRPEFINRLMGFRRYTRIVDLTHQEVASDRPAFLEGTGSLVLDRIRRVG
mmetsp:Transcript_39096/g.63357  ORF Transcript_39096/g.63357 Transcript_39096/m.63357 type:complete len:373 (+) Transcript_39096:105-1223(+)